MRKTVFLVLAALITGGPAVAAGPPDAPVVQVSEARGLYSVAARFTVTEMPADVLAVLTDYEQIPRFMPRIQTSIVHQRTEGHAVVEQEATSRVMMVSKRIHLMLEVEEQSGGMTFRDRSGKSFERYEGSWRVSRKGRVTTVVYELKADPSFDVPEFMLKRLLRRDSGDMIEQLQREVTRRAAAA
ncbi:MAG: SRPBCC family protein, partial [Vicinamibacterales bacterium]